ncbi:hypothetical protein Anas_13876 [Armadillidium nasatum]|uniref:Ig-like domain-containing protein n=1 Tax=Armadillidium nasatum TaxID=96803 RepID=A0A5N5T5U8_9CRUS|nr:hypothetical protein Anas_13876 [Armadillidium nasatum]
MTVIVPPSGPPKISGYDHTHISVIKGQRLSLMCSVPMATPQPKIEWKINNNNVRKKRGMDNLSSSFIRRRPIGVCLESGFCDYAKNDRRIHRRINHRVYHATDRKFLYTEGHLGAPTRKIILLLVF